MKIWGRQRHKSLIVNYQHEQCGIDFGPGGAGPYRAVCMAGLNFGQLCDKKRDYKIFLKKALTDFFGWIGFQSP
jgi:hypothetical protein